MADRNLAGAGVLVTRPEQQAAELCSAIQSCGGAAILFPVIRIVPRNENEIRKDAREQGRPDISIFVSGNAVRYGIGHVGEELLGAVGPATANAIRAAGRDVGVLPADGFDSEHLLAARELCEVAGKTIRIVRGGRGRELLATTLRERGATVSYLDVYERAAPRYSERELEQLEAQWRSGDIDVVTVMSVESLQNLIRILPAWCKEALASTPLVTPAKRVIKEAGKRIPGIPTMLADGPQARSMLDAILACIETRPGKTS